MSETNDIGGKPVGTREWYDFVADLSDVVPIMHLGGRAATRRLLEMCRLDASSRVLDVGCGAGNTACDIAEQYGSRVQGIDISEAMTVKAEERARRRGGRTWSSSGSPTCSTCLLTTMPSMWHW